MATLTVSTTISYGDTTSDGAVQRREPFELELSYTEASIKTVQLAAGLTDESVTLDSVGSPKFLLVHSLETGVEVKLHDGSAADNPVSAVAEGEGWIMIANPNGQSINELLVTTPASPTSGARLRVVSFE